MNVGVTPLILVITVADIGLGALTITTGGDKYPDPPFVGLDPPAPHTFAVLIAPFTGGNGLVQVASVPPTADASTPYCLHDPTPGTPTTPPDTAGVEQYFP